MLKKRFNKERKYWKKEQRKRILSVGWTFSSSIFAVWIAHIFFIFPFWVQIFPPNIKCSLEAVPDSNDNRFTIPEEKKKKNPGEITVYQNYQMEIELLQANSIPGPTKMMSILRTSEPKPLPVSWMCASLIGPKAAWRLHMHWATELFVKVSWFHIATVLGGTQWCTSALLRVLKGRKVYFKIL